MTAALEPTNGQVANDGKTLRRSYDRDSLKNRKTVDVVSLQHQFAGANARAVCRSSTEALGY